jgi:hypothetical protein
MARIITSLASLIAMGSTLVLPIYPEGIDPLILAFLGMAGIGAVFGLADRRSRHELAVMAPWAAALLLGVLIGSLHHGEALQAVEDVLPYLLFVMGLVAGRGTGSPRRLLQVCLFVCVADSVVSLWLMESFAAGVRSTFTYYKITAGLPLVGLYLAAILRETPEPGAPKKPWDWLVHAACVVMLVLGIVFSISRGMLLGTLMAIAISGYVRRPSQALLIATLALVGLLVWSSAFSEFGNEYLRFGQGGTIEGRFREVEVAWEGFIAAPMFGQGLGALADVDGFKKAFVHNMAAYHLWKFGLVGSGLIVVPLVIIARELRGHKRSLRAHALGAAAGIIGYLVTCAAYKTYYLVWIYGAVIGASLSHFAEWRDRMQASGVAGGTPNARETLARPSPRRGSAAPS